MKTKVEITEDYVSYEVARLLKRKGFPQKYDIYHSMVYNEKNYKDKYEIQRGVIETKLVKAGTLSSYPVGVPNPKCYCPTIQMALKWLRAKSVLITYDLAPIGTELMVKVYKRVYDNPNYTWTEGITIIRKSLEDAINAALKYSLENLI